MAKLWMFRVPPIDGCLKWLCIVEIQKRSPLISDISDISEIRFRRSKVKSNLGELFVTDGISKFVKLLARPELVETERHS